MSAMPAATASPSSSVATLGSAESVKDPQDARGTGRTAWPGSAPPVNNNNKRHVASDSTAGTSRVDSSGRRTPSASSVPEPKGLNAMSSVARTAPAAAPGSPPLPSSTLTVTAGQATRGPGGSDYHGSGVNRAPRPAAIGATASTAAHTAVSIAQSYVHARNQTKPTFR